MQIQNPIIPGFNPDPSICKHDGWYYVVTSSFEYFPGLPIHRSRDLAQWELIGYAMDRADQCDLRDCRWSHGIWAPCIRRVGDTFVLAATMVGKEDWPAKFRNFFITADSPEGPWSDPRWIDQGGIDPEIVELPEGVFYFRNGEGGVVGAPFDMETGKPTQEPTLLWRGSGFGWPEGPHCFHIDGRYYLQIAEGGTGPGHSVTMARADHPLGPYEPCPHNPILSNRGRNNPIQACGHADLIQHDDGSWWAVHLGIRDYSALSALGRETFLVPVSWHDGWPIYGQDGVCTPTIELPHVDRVSAVDDDWHDDFSDPIANHHWNTRRNLRPGAIRRGDGRLQLRPLADSIDGELALPTWYGVRQRHQEAAWTCTVLPPPAGSRAAVSVWMNELWRYDLELRHDGQTGVATLRSVLGGTTATMAEHTINGDQPIECTIRADGTRYHFAINGEDLGAAPAVCISSIVSGGFTGAFFALWADGCGRDHNATWDITRASYTVERLCI